MTGLVVATSNQKDCLLCRWGVYNMAVAAGLESTPNLHIIDGNIQSPDAAAFFGLRGDPVFSRCGGIYSVVQRHSYTRFSSGLSTDHPIKDP
jgi:hypothetical protein